MHVYIDGENLRHRLVQALREAHLLENNHQSFHLNVTALLTKVLSERPEAINYYTSRVKQPTFPIPDKLADKINEIQEINRRWIADLTNEGVNVIKAGYLKVHDSTRCLHCGQITQVLQEKGVDVRLATDMVLAAAQDHITHIVVLSSDADMIPAIDHVRQSGTRVTYLCFDEELNKGVAAVVDEVLTYSRDDVVQVFKGESA